MQINPNVIFGCALVCVAKQGLYVIDVTKMTSYLAVITLRLNALGYTVSCTQAELRMFVRKYSKYCTYTVSKKIPNFIVSIELNKSINLEKMERCFCNSLTDNVKEILDAEFTEFAHTMGW